jgi:large subunit ribosomal protein L22
MSFGTKTNERPGTRAQVKYTRVSAYKAREVLDLIRGEQVARALEILEFADRDVAQVILKCLESAIANAEHNDQLPADELYVSACFADEGPTLKRWRPRARGRATRIRKRTCHITIIVSRLEPDELERLRAREAASGGRGGGRAAAEARRRRVLRSRQTKADKKAAEAADHDDHDHDHDDHDHDDHDHDHGDEGAETEPVETSDATDATDADEGTEVTAETTDESTDEIAAETTHETADDETDAASSDEDDEDKDS